MGMSPVTLNGRPTVFDAPMVKKPRLIELASFVSRRSEAIINEFHPI